MKVIICFPTVNGLQILVQTRSQETASHSIKIYFEGTAISEVSLGLLDLVVRKTQEIKEED